MKSIYPIAAAILVATWGSLSVAQAGQSSYDPAAHAAPSKPRDSFIDFTLKRINPSDANYGQCLSEDRRILLEETLRSAYFWSNIVALGVLGWLFLVMVYQQKVRTRREWTGNYWAQCPSCAQHGRDQSRDNLAISVADPRKYKCWAGCTKEMIRAALGHPIRVRRQAGYAISAGSA
jgi:hypothetical protein